MILSLFMIDTLIGLYSTCPTYLNIFALILYLTVAIPDFLLVHSFLTFSALSCVHLNILIFATLFLDVLYLNCPIS